MNAVQPQVVYVGGTPTGPEHHTPMFVAMTVISALLAIGAVVVIYTKYNDIPDGTFPYQDKLDNLTTSVLVAVPLLLFVSGMAVARTSDLSNVVTMVFMLLFSGFIAGLLIIPKDKIGSIGITHENFLTLCIGLSTVFAFVSVIVSPSMIGRFLMMPMAFLVLCMSVLDFIWDKLPGLLPVSRTP